MLFFTLAALIVAASLGLGYTLGHQAGRRYGWREVARVWRRELDARKAEQEGGR
jgi:hypothetical protein